MSEKSSIKSHIEIRETLEKKTIATKVIDNLLNGKSTTTKPKKDVLANITDEQRAQLIEIEGNAIAGFIGDFSELETALGMLSIGHHVGWKVLYLIHSKRTIRKYEDILGIKIREIFPETGPSSYRSLGLELAMKASNFWKVVSGEHKIDKDFKQIDK